MNTTEILDELERRGVCLEPRGERLHVDAPQGVLTDELREALATHKGEILSLLQEGRSAWPPESFDAERRFGTPHARLYPFIGKSLETPRGPGRLVQVFSDRAAVILEQDPSRLTFFLPGEVRPPGVPAPRELVPAGAVH